MPQDLVLQTFSLKWIEPGAMPLVLMLQAFNL
jgi:hypothetical protein